MNNKGVETSAYPVLVNPSDDVLVMGEVVDDAGDVQGAPRLHVQVCVPQDLSFGHYNKNFL